METLKKGFAWLKSHPFIAVVGIGGIVLLFIFMSSGSGGAAGSSGSGDVPTNKAALDAAQIQAGTQLSLAQVAAGVQNNNTQAALQANSDNNALAALEANLSAELQKYEIGTQYSLASQQQQAQTNEIEAFILENAHDPRWVASAFGTDTPPGSFNISQLTEYDQATGH